MTGWAATNTLRSALVDASCGNSDAGERDWKERDVTYEAALALVETALDAADDAIANCLPVLAIEGSDKSGYRWSGSVQTTYVALLQEWRDAAEAICAAHAALRAVREGAS